MSDTIIEFLSAMAFQIITLIGVAYIPLIVTIIFRAGQLRGLTEDNMAERLGDLFCDTLKEHITDRIMELLKEYFGNFFQLPPGVTLVDLASELHNDSESIDQLCEIFKQLMEVGVQSAEFQTILTYLAPFL